MENIIILVIIIAIVGAACTYIHKEKKKGRKCIGCPSSGTCSACKCGSNSKAS